MLVKELHQNSIIVEKSSLAHYLHQLLAEKKISLEDDASKIDFNQADYQKVSEMIQNNVLGFHKIGIYSLKVNQSPLPLSMPKVRKRPFNFVPTIIIEPH